MKKPGIGLPIDQLVLRRFAANAVPQDLQRAAIFVHARVIKRCAIGVPDRRALHIGHLIRKLLARHKVAQLDLEELRALVVEGVGHQPVIVAPNRRTQREERLARRHRVAIEQHRGLAAVARLPADARMLPAHNVAREIGVGAIGRGHGGVVLLDAALHLLEQRVLQRLRIRHRLGGECVLRLKIGADIRGPSEAGSRITSCQFSARSHA